MALWVLAALALMIAVASLAWVRRLGRRVDTLNQSYWELRYDYTRLRSQVSRLDPEQALQNEEDAPTPAPAPPSVSFVPLSSMKKKS